jgi:diketogulonate reductase-like aldo/keto reductase
MSSQTYLTLNNGVKIPQFGLGAFLIDGDDNTEKVVLEALNLGFRHIDTAHAYFNEIGVGRALKKSKVPRNEIFITSKLWPSEYGEDLSYKAVLKMLKRLDLDYIDMVLLHHPMRDYVGAWKALEKLNKEGKVKCIGISNFDKDYKRLDEILKNATIKPAVCQSECHPYNSLKKLKEVLAPCKTAIEAYYPIGHGDKKLIEEEIFTKLAKKYKKTNVQIILRWHIQMGHIIFPKTSNPVHLKENFEIFDFNLTNEEMNEIKKLDAGKYYFYPPFEEYEKIIDSYNDKVAKYD